MQRITCSLLAVALFIIGTAASAQEAAEAVGLKYTWNLMEIYPFLWARVTGHSCV